MTTVCIGYNNNKFDNYLKLYKGIDICVNINTYQNDIFLNKLKNNILKSVGFSEFDDTTIREFKKFFGYDINKKIVPVMEKNIYGEDKKLFLSKLLENYKNISARNDYSIINNMINNSCFCELYFNKMSENIKINNIVCLQCQHYDIYFIKCDYYSNCNNIKIIKMKNYREDLLILEKDKIIFINGLDKTIKIINEEKDNFLIKKYDNINSVKINKMRPEQNANFELITNFTEKNIICVECISEIHKGNSAGLFSIMSHNRINKTIKNSVILGLIVGKTFLICDYKMQDILCTFFAASREEQHVIKYDIKNNTVEIRKVTEIKFNSKTELFNFYINPDSLFNNFELINKFSLPDNLKINNSVHQIQKHNFKYEKNLVTLDIKTEKYDILIKLCDYEKKYSIVKYDKFTDKYEIHSNFKCKKVLLFN